MPPSPVRSPTVRMPSPKHWSIPRSGSDTDSSDDELLAQPSTELGLDGFVPKLEKSATPVAISSPAARSPKHGGPSIWTRMSPPSDSDDETNFSFSTVALRSSFVAVKESPSAGDARKSACCHRWVFVMAE